MKRISFIFMLVCLLLSAATDYCAAAKVTLGIERCLEKNIQRELAGKRLGVLTNQSGVDSKLNGSLDILMKNYQVTAVFVPEHGLFGEKIAGEEFGDQNYGGVPVFSLYSNQKRPSAKMLENIDIMCVDLQDVGVRHYTYVSTLAYVMEECAKAGKQVIVFDRPNPLSGVIQGPTLKEEYQSFIGLFNVPLRHGLTIGEYARYINAEEKIGCALTVVPMRGWRRDMYWEDTGLYWVETSPLIPTAETALLYCITGVCGDTNISVGAATAKPFYYVGADFADASRVTQALNDLHLPGMRFRPKIFIPRHGKYQGKLLQGCEIYVADKRVANLPEAGYWLIYAFNAMYPEQVKFPQRKYVPGSWKTDIALGENSIRMNEPPQQVFARWRAENELFGKLVKKYLLY